MNKISIISTTSSMANSTVAPIITTREDMVATIVIIINKVATEDTMATRVDSIKRIISGTTA